MSNVTPVTVAYGDGIGPEIMAASLHIIQEAGARIQIENIEIGEKAYLRGNKETVALLSRVLDQGIDIVKTESLRTYVGKPGYTLAQGQ
jgi:isocitrate/isopropylmalate dehydrogenase